MSVFHRHIRHVAGLAVLVTLAIRVRALASGFVLDDFFHMAAGRGIFAVSRRPWDLFAFMPSEGEVHAGIAAGTYPWWTDPDVRLNFFRPLSSLFTYFDARVIGPNALLQHLHSAAWLAALTIGAALLYARLLTPRVAVIATLLYAVDEAVTMPLAWVANRSALVASTFAVYALVAWTFRRTSRRAAIGCEVLTALAVLSGEYGIGVLFLRAGLALSETERPIASRVSRSALLLAGVLAYAVFHRAAGYGVTAFPLYRDPTGDLGGYLAWAGEQLRGLVQDLTIGVSAAQKATAITSAGALAMLFSLTVVVRRSARSAGRADEASRALALTLGGLLSLFPLASSIAHTRLLILPALGMCALCAIAIDFSFAVLRSGDERWLVRSGFGIFVALAAFIHGPLAALRSYQVGNAPVVNERRLRATLAAPAEAGGRVILLSGGDPTTILYFREVRALYGKAVPADFRVLTASPNAQRLFRVDDRTIDIEMPRSGLLATALPAVMRAKGKGLPAGETVDGGPMQVTVLERGANGPSRVRYRFDQSLDAPGTVVLTSRPTGFEVFALPAVGASAGIPPGADPVGSDR